MGCKKLQNSEKNNHLSPDPELRLTLPSEDGKPKLIVSIDVEEDFDWSAPFSSDNTKTASIEKLVLLQDIFDRYEINPVLLVDYPVADDARSVEVRRQFTASNNAEVAAQLHPWGNPPLEEQINQRNSFPGNLPEALERSKLTTLVRKISDSLGSTPRIYRAGRSGIGPNTARILQELDFEIDMSVYAHRNLAGNQGPDFSDISSHPYWFGTSTPRLLEIPITSGFYGTLGGFGKHAHQVFSKPQVRWMRGITTLSWLNLVTQASLTPEGVPLEESKRLTRTLYSSGHRVFTLSFHSPSLEPGNTPYVRTEQDLERFLKWLSDFLAFFSDEMSGEFITTTQLLTIANRPAVHEDKLAS